MLILIGDRVSAIADRIAVVGAGAWGTALANVIARAGRSVTLYARDVGTIAGRRESPRLPGVKIDTRVAIAALAERRLEDDVVLIAVPAQALRAAAYGLAGSLAPGVPVVLGVSWPLGWARSTSG